MPDSSTAVRRLLAVLLCLAVVGILPLVALPAGAQQPTPVLTETPTPTPTRTIAELTGVGEEAATAGELFRRYGMWGMVGLLIFAALAWVVFSITKKAGESLVDYVVRVLQKTFSGIVARLKRKQALDTGTTSYLAWLQDELKHLPILPIKSADRKEQLRLQDVYVPLRVVERTQMESFRRLTMGEFDEGGEFRLRREAFEHLERNKRVFCLLSDSLLLPALAHEDTLDDQTVREPTAKYVLVIGDAGSGKTTTLQYGALVLAHDYVQQSTTGARETLDLHCPKPLLPFYIRLTLVATYVRETYRRGQSADIPMVQDAPSRLLLEWLDSYICSQVKTSRREIPEDMPSKRIADGGCLVMLDGLDETGDEWERNNIQRLIINLKQDYPNNRYLVASRPFEDLRLSGAGFEERHLSPMNGEEMQTLLDNWFHAMQKQADMTHRQRESANNQIAHLWGILEHNARLFEMATNPLLLTSMSLMVYNGTGLPRERAKLYYNLVELLLEKWRSEQLSGGDPWKKDQQSLLFGEEETIESVRRRLQKIAAWMQEQERREFRLREAQEQLRADYEKFKGWHRDKSDDYVCQLMASLSLESGLIQQRDTGYSFAHYTLQEYLTAREYDERDGGVKELFQHYQQRRWRETILLAVGHWSTSGYPSRAIELLQQLLGTQETDALLLAASALDDADADRVLELTPLRNETIDRLRTLAFSPADCPAPTTRNEAAELLDRLGGDDRAALDFTHEAYWAERERIEPGEFILGDDNGKRGNEKPSIRYRILHPYKLARFPVTNRQYLAFLQDLERQERSEEARKRRPLHWPGKQYRAGEGNHPVVMVSWQDVTAFAAWLDDHLKAQGVIPASDLIRLPTDPEWERAAAYPVRLTAADLSVRNAPIRGATRLLNCLTIRKNTSWQRSEATANKVASRHVCCRHFSARQRGLRGRRYGRQCLGILRNAIHRV